MLILSKLEIEQIIKKKKMLINALQILLTDT